MINWPAVIKHEADDELTYIGSGAEWEGDADLHAVLYNLEDYMIDSDGHIYDFRIAERNFITPVETDKQISVQSFTGLVQAHAATVGECCIEKILFTSVANGITMVGNLSMGVDDKRE